MERDGIQKYMERTQKVLSRLGNEKDLITHKGIETLGNKIFENWTREETKIVYELSKATGK